MKTLYSGQTLSCIVNDDSIAELSFNLQGESVNKLNFQTLKELKEALTLLKKQDSLQALLLMSGKDSFIAGADITEFLTYFNLPAEQLKSWLLDAHTLFNDIEDLTYPSFSLIQGYALGGGLEITLATTYRILSRGGKVGLPETQLGIIPGWGGTVRLPRLIGADNAIEWISSGKQASDQEAMKVGVVDAVVDATELKSTALSMIKEISEGKRNWRQRREKMLAPLTLPTTESNMVFESARAFIAGTLGANYRSYPAPFAAIQSIQQGGKLPRKEAQALEVENFSQVARSDTAKCLVQLFLNDQQLKKQSKQMAKAGQEVRLAATLGAGIMGGGIAYQNASRKIPVIMKDIRPEALQLGYSEANKLFKKLAEIGKATIHEVTAGLNLLHGTLSYGEFEKVDIVVEAVVENANVKKQVFKEVEAIISSTAIIASNTSTISITELGRELKNPERFCGMHFFNPVHKMPLVEIIRSKLTDEKTIATVVRYAESLGKKPIVVNDCPGFYVNRILFPYLIGFAHLIEEGADFKYVDKVMEKFGWPMGPAYLLDVVGIDTCHHCLGVMGAGFPDRMTTSKSNLISAFYYANFYGQKNGLGFYAYAPDKKGRPQKQDNPKVAKLLTDHSQANLLEKSRRVPQRNPKDFSDKEIVNRLMLPMIFEAVRTLEEKIISSVVDGDCGVLYGLGFPPFRTGIFAYADQIGLPTIIEEAKAYQHLGQLYSIPKLLLEMANGKESFYQR